MSSLQQPVKDLANKLGLGGVAALAAGAVLVAGVTAVGAANGADDRPSSTPVTVSVPGGDDGTPDQGSGDAPGTTSTVVTTSTVAPTTAAPAATRTIPVPGVGEVVVDEATLGLVSATPAPGFTVRTESSARELHVRFFAPDGGRIDVQVELEDGVPRIRIRDRRLEGGGHGGDDAPTVTTVPAAPSPTVDDHGGRVDRDDRDEAGDDRDGSSGSDDRSGHGGGDDESGDDHSGRGSDD